MADVYDNGDETVLPVGKEAGSTEPLSLWFNPTTHSSRADRPTNGIMDGRSYCHVKGQRTCGLGSGDLRCGGRGEAKTTCKSSFGLRFLPLGVIFSRGFISLGCEYLAESWRRTQGRVPIDRLIRENSDIFSDTQCKVCSAVLISESQKLAHYQSKKHANKVRRYKCIQQGEDFSPPKKKKPEVQESNDAVDRNKCCPICNMTFSSPVVAESHYTGKTHAKNLKLKEQGGVIEVTPVAKKIAKTTPASGPKGDEKVDENDPERFCKICRATFNNPQMSQQHYMGKKHKKQETKNKIMTTYTSSGNSLPQTANIKPAVPGCETTVKGFSCDTCNIVLNSIEQHQAHISGAKHKNQLKSMLPTCSMSFEDCSPFNSQKSALPSFEGISSPASAPSVGGHSSIGTFSSSKSYSSIREYSPVSGLSSSVGLSSSRGFSSSLRLSSSRGFSSSESLLSSGGISSSGGYSSTAGLLSGSFSGKSGTTSGLLPSPYSSTNHNKPYVREDMMGPDGYGYFNKDF
ncbi:zinc finger protein 346 [Pelodytes ibericus]